MDQERYIVIYGTPFAKEGELNYSRPSKPVAAPNARAAAERTIGAAVEGSKAVVFDMVTGKVHRFERARPPQPRLAWEPTL